MFIRRRSLAQPATAHPLLRKLCIGLCAGAGFGLGAHLALFANIIGPSLPEPTMAHALNPNTLEVGTTVTFPDYAFNGSDQPGSNLNSEDQERSLLKAAQPVAPEEEQDDTVTSQSDDSNAGNEPVPALDEEPHDDEGPRGPDATLAEATGMPMAGGPSANPLEALLQVVAKYQDGGATTTVEAYDEATGTVVYALEPAR